MVPICFQRTTEADLMPGVLEGPGQHCRKPSVTGWPIAALTQIPGCWWPVCGIVRRLLTAWYERRRTTLLLARRQLLLSRLVVTTWMMKLFPASVAAAGSSLPHTVQQRRLRRLGSPPRRAEVIEARIETSATHVCQDR